VANDKRDRPKACTKSKMFTPIVLNVKLIIK